MRQSFRALNGLRFFAAMAVVWFHYATRVRGFERLPLGLQRLVACGPVALGFFFILSGFLLAYVHPSETLECAGAYRRFWFARWARLYPAYLVAFLLFAPIAADKYLLHPYNMTRSADAGVFAGSAVLSALMLQAWTPLSQAWNGPSWSLSVEAFFYLLFPLLVVSMHRWSTRAAFLLAFAAWVPMVLLTLAATLGILPATIWDGYLRNNPVLWTPLFLLGIVLARLLPRWLLVSRNRAEAVTVLTAAAIIAACLLCPERYQELLITCALAPLLALAVLAFSHQQTRSARLLGLPMLDALGRASYVVYILQAPLWHLFRVGTDRLAHHASSFAAVSWWQFLLFVPVLVGLSLLVQATIERPLHQRLMRRSRTAVTPTANASGAPSTLLEPAS